MKIVAYTFENIPFAPGNFLRRLMLRYHAKNVDGVTSCNQAGVDNLQAADARFPTQRIFRGVELSLFAAQDKTESRKKLGIPQDAKVMGYVGRIIPEKGLDDILSALALLPDYFSVMVGNGTYQPALEKRARELGISDRVKWFPGVAASQLAAYYSSFDVCVLASHTTNTWKEQYGMVLVEAMACKLGVVGSSSGAIPEVLRGYPKGAIFPEGDAQALVAAVRKVESLQLPPSFDLPGFLDQFSNRNFAAAHIAFFKQLLNHG